MHLIHLSTRHDSLALLETRSEHFRQPTGGQNHLTQGLRHGEVLNISRDVLNTVLGVAEWPYGCRTVVRRSAVTPVMRGRLGAAVPRRSGGSCRSPGTGSENSNFQVCYLQNVDCFHTIMNSKNCKLKHHKSGTICSENN